MNVKRLTARHGAVNGKLMVMTHQRSDVAAIEAFMGRIGAYDALLICKSVRGIRVGNTRYPIEVLLWLMACYNNPYFVKTFYLNKYFGYENDTVATRIERTVRNRLELRQFVDAYTLQRSKYGYARNSLSGLLFSFEGEPSYYYEATKTLERRIKWTNAGRMYPWPHSIDVLPLDDGTCDVHCVYRSKPEGLSAKSYRFKNDVVEAFYARNYDLRVLKIKVY
jgi:hypothetical protein